ncbi:hypothetical protein U9M48_044276 [Paspalum notatum var. saurae]|uniref:Knottin scorpion toxin-like domain-containing protein n=1 Tax=Paspalum notatum var. saurae TaxID=547442 RepID=A0AAQ3XI85_PASNO
MATSRTAMASGLLLWLLLVHCGMAPCVLASADDCWTGSPQAPLCAYDDKCQAYCKEQGQASGRCHKMLMNPTDRCECLLPNCLL